MLEGNQQLITDVQKYIMNLYVSCCRSAMPVTAVQSKNIDLHCDPFSYWHVYMHINYTYESASFATGHKLLHCLSHRIRQDMQGRATAVLPLAAMGTPTPSTLKQTLVQAYNTSPWFPCTLSTIYRIISQSSVLRALKYKSIHEQNCQGQT